MGAPRRDRNQRLVKTVVAHLEEGLCVRMVRNLWSLRLLSMHDHTPDFRNDRVSIFTRMLDTLRWFAPTLGVVHEAKDYGGGKLAVLQVEDDVLPKFKRF
jgi:hypothetical protein